MTNRILARDIVRAVADEAAKVVRGERADWTPIDAAVESALDAERKAGELEGQIKALEWAKEQPDTWAACNERLARLRAEKAKLR